MSNPKTLRDIIHEMVLDVYQAHVKFMGTLDILYAYCDGELDTGVVRDLVCTCYNFGNDDTSGLLKAIDRLLPELPNETPQPGEPAIDLLFRCGCCGWDFTVHGVPGSYTKAHHTWTCPHCGRGTEDNRPLRVGYQAKARLFVDLARGDSPREENS